MKLTDLQPLDRWMALEKEIVQRFHVDANVFDSQGVRISAFKVWANRLCPAIKATDKGQAFICAVAHMNIAAEARQTRRPVIEECDAGLVKIVVPIFWQNRFLGAVGACGVLLDGGEVDTFLINKVTDMEEDTADSLSEDIDRITSEKAAALARFVQEKIDGVLRGTNHPKPDGSAP
jgi:ligand-binding sensor protein